jgi:uncharacterized protein YuzE
VKVFYEPDAELLTVFWQDRRRDQVCTELDDGVILIKGSTTGEPIGIELLSYRPGDACFDAVSVEIGRTPAAAPFRPSGRADRQPRSNLARPATCSTSAGLVAGEWALRAAERDP